MSVEAVSLVLGCFPDGGGMRLLAIALADAASQEGCNIYKSVSTLATHSHQSERTVQRMLPKLLAAGWLELEGDGKGGKGRTNSYRISADWMACAHYELGAAKAERRQPNVVPFRSGELELSPKGDKLTPFAGNTHEAERVTNQTPKGDKFEPKGDKNAPKGDTYMSPEHRTLNVLTNTPLPPKGGAPVDNFQSRENPAIGQNAHAKLLAELIAVHPAHDTADTANASRALAQCADRALEPLDQDVSDLDRHDDGDHSTPWDAFACSLVAALRADAKTPRWQTDAHRYAPKLSKWLRGRMAMQALPDHVRPAPASDGLQAVEAAAKACGLGGFEEWRTKEYGRTGCVPSWANFRDVVSAMRGARA